MERTTEQCIKDYEEMLIKCYSLLKEVKRTTEDKSLEKKTHYLCRDIDLVLSRYMPEVVGGDAPFTDDDYI